MTPYYLSGVTYATTRERYRDLPLAEGQHYLVRSAHVPGQPELVDVYRLQERELYDFQAPFRILSGEKLEENITP